MYVRLEHGEEVKYPSHILGTNYRMTEIQAAISMTQLKKLPCFLMDRLHNAERLTKHLKRLEKIVLLPKL